MQQRRQEKAKKRAVNIEIASELLDLIFDVMETANEEMEVARQNRLENDDSDEEKDLLTKATWREWMNVFSEGKKVSEINLVLEDDDLTRGSMAGADSMAQILGGEGTQHTPYSLMKEVRNEPIYNDFLQYLA